jgi:hypothetical protein
VRELVHFGEGGSDVVGVEQVDELATNHLIFLPPQQRRPRRIHDQEPGFEVRD